MEEGSKRPKFSVGDVVVHRASGERGVVVGVLERCVTHAGMGQMMGADHLAGRGCVREFSGDYEISVGSPGGFKDRGAGGQGARYAEEVELDAAQGDPPPLICCNNTHTWLIDREGAGEILLGKPCSCGQRRWGEM